MSLRPRLVQQELALWTEFTPLAKGKYKDFSFDVKVKPAREILNIEDKEYYKNWDDLSCPRIDVYGINEKDQPVVFEVRENADFSTLASVIAYSALMKTTGQLQRDPELVIICREITKNTRSLANMHGIKIYEIPSFIDKKQTTLV